MSMQSSSGAGEQRQVTKLRRIGKRYVHFRRDMITVNKDVASAEGDQIWVNCKKGGLHIFCGLFQASRRMDGWK